MWAMSICQGDWDILENHDGINDLEKDHEVTISPIENITNHVVSIPDRPILDDISKITTACESDTGECCLNCKPEDAIKVIITTSNDNAEAADFVGSCAVARNSDEPLIEFKDSTMWAMSICQGDWDILENHDGINDLEKDDEVTIPERPIVDDISKITTACESDTGKCCLNCKPE